MKKWRKIQILMGLVMLVISALIPFIDGDASAVLITIPLGLVLIASKEKIIDVDIE